jgi:hypothetical protein
LILLPVATVYPNFEPTQLYTRSVAAHFRSSLASVTSPLAQRTTYSCFPVKTLDECAPLSSVSNSL